MKKKLLFLAWLLAAAPVGISFSQCKAPISNFTFEQSLKKVKEGQTADRRLQLAKDFAKANCMLASQAKSITETLDDDYDKLDFVKTAFPNIYDKENLYEVYDRFAYFSTVFRLHDFVLAQKTNTGNGGGNNGNSGSGYYDEYTFPDYNGYKGTKGCNMPMADRDAEVLKKQVAELTNEQSKLNRAKAVVDGNCLAVSQIMKLSLALDMESSRLEFLKHAYPKSYDMANYSKVVQTMQHQPYKEAILNLIQYGNGAGGTGDNGNTGNNNSACMVNDSEFADMKKIISQQSFSNARVNLAKQIIKKRCFNTNQVIEMVKLFDFDDSRLDIAKFCYAFTTDKNRYYMLNSGIFSFESSATALMKFVDEQK